MKINLPSEARRGTFIGDIKPVLDRYSPNFKHYPDFTNLEIARYGLIQKIDGNKITVVAIHNLLSFDPNLPNITLEVCSSDIETNKKIMNELELKTGLKLEPIPQELKQKYPINIQIDF